MSWYLIYTKPRQEYRALENLVRQGYECYLPKCQVEKLKQRQLVMAKEPLFPRYLFINWDDTINHNWVQIRSTLGVSRLVSFGGSPAKVDDSLVKFLRQRENIEGGPVKSRFDPGVQVLITSGPFAGIEAVFQMNDGASRAFVLIEFLNKTTKLAVPQSNLRKV